MKNIKIHSLVLCILNCQSHISNSYQMNSNRETIYLSRLITLEPNIDCKNEKAFLKYKLLKELSNMVSYKRKGSLERTED